MIITNKFLVVFSLLFTIDYSPVENTNGCDAIVPSGFNFLKNWDIKSVNGEYEQVSFVLTKGTQYSFSFCNESFTDSKNFRIEDSKRNSVFTGKIPETNVVNFNCQVTGIYYVLVKGCNGKMVLAFKR